MQNYPEFKELTVWMLGNFSWFYFKIYVFKKLLKEYYQIVWEFFHYFLLSADYFQELRFLKKTLKGILSRVSGNFLWSFLAADYFQD